MATGGVGAAKLTKAEIHKIVNKDSNERLISELTRGQNKLSVQQIRALTRPVLVANVTALRFVAGQSNAVQNIVQGFIPIDVASDDDDDTFKDEPQTLAQEPGQTQTSVLEQIPVQPHVSTTATDTLAAMLLQMQVQYQQMQQQMQQQQLKSDERALAAVKVR